MSKTLQSYLTNYAEPEIRVPGFPQQYRYQYSLVVPAFSESIHCIDLLMGNIRNHALLILVANAPQGEAESTQHFTREILQKFPCQWSNQHLYLLNYTHTKDILLIDRCSEGRTIPKRQGVGLARKIGFDMASKLILQGNVESPWINTTDADVTLPRDYPDQAAGQVNNAAARLYPFRHISSPGLGQAIGLYDIALQYYLDGLRYAGSPYAYHAIGSTMCIHYHSYAQVRGFPRKAAAEDFYMLNKLAKVGRIEPIDAPVLAIQARLSDRVPFGTGHALGSILELDDPLKEYLYYNPSVFLLLRNWLEVIPEIWPNRHQANIDFLTRKAGENRQILRDCLVASGIDQIVHKGLNQYRSPETFERYLHQWFDAFKTLKFIHLVRDRYFKSLPLETLTGLPLFARIGIKSRSMLENAELNLPGYQRGDHD